MVESAFNAGVRPTKVAAHHEIPPNGQESFYLKYGKRSVDLIGAIVLLMIFAPLIIILLGLVAADGASPIFGHKRIGKNGKLFSCWKVRTMVPGAEDRLNSVLKASSAARVEWEETRKLKFDPRITKTGKFLRSTSLDELPQLWNVLVGEMSLVGPRPVTNDELTLYGNAAETYKTMRPGVTGPWQVSGRGEVSYDTRISMDSRYKSDISAAYDLKILAQTTSVVLARTGS